MVPKWTSKSLVPGLNGIAISLKGLHLTIRPLYSQCLHVYLVIAVMPSIENQKIHCPAI